MELLREDRDGAAIIRYQGARLDAASAIRFKDRFRDLIDGETQRYILDLSEVDFMDSSGLGAVVAVFKLLGEKHALDLAALTPAVDRVFRLTRMDSVFRIFQTIEEAQGLAASGTAAHAPA
ncbi:MAG: STAS domain-containing protein [Paracoccaceae bacterium]